MNSKTQSLAEALTKDITPERILAGFKKRPPDFWDHKPQIKRVTRKPNQNHLPSQQEPQ